MLPMLKGAFKNIEGFNEAAAEIAADDAHDRAFVVAGAMLQ